MGFFTSRKDKEAAAALAAHSTTDATIAEFWQWWAAEGSAAAAATFDGERDDAALQRVAETVGSFAERLELGFEFGKGRTARHVLVFTPAGDPNLAEVADRWLAAAPAADDAFEYDSRRRAAQDPAGIGIRFGDHSFEIADMLLVAEPHGDRIDVHVWHPAFAEAPREVAGNVTFLLLDALLGEEVVETRIGEVRFDREVGPQARPLLDLPGLLG